MTGMNEQGTLARGELRAACGAAQASWLRRSFVTQEPWYQLSGGAAGGTEQPHPVMGLGPLSASPLGTPLWGTSAFPVCKQLVSTPPAPTFLSEAH